MLKFDLPFWGQHKTIDQQNGIIGNGPKDDLIGNLEMNAKKKDWITKSDIYGFPKGTPPSENDSQKC